MNPQAKKELLAFALAAVLIAQLLGTGLLEPLLISAVTGRVLTGVSTEPTAPPATENSISPTETTQQSEPDEIDAVLSFSSAALPETVLLWNCGADLQQLLEQPLQWELTGSEPTVLILHTHATEGYTGDYAATDAYRTLDEAQNMLAVGDELARVLTLGGISALHDRTLHDYPDYNSAYSSARTVIKAYLEAYPSIRLVLDLHRDASGEDAPLVTSATVGGQSSAQLLFVVGTNGGGSYHPDWQENLALALKLTALLEQENPGICRPVSVRPGRYNGDLSTGSLLVEVGANGDTLPEALIAVNALAQAIVELAHGSR